MRILVTGANGLLGQKLVELIPQQKGVHLTATGRDQNRNVEGSYTYLSADLTVNNDVEELIRSCKPTHIIHCAAMTQVDDCERNPQACKAINVEATRLVLEKAKNLAVHFLYVSTDFVFDGLSGPYSESDEPNPLSIYGQSKLEAEVLVRNSGLKWSIARTVLVYGVSRDMTRSNIVLWAKKSLEQNKRIKVVTDQWRTPTLVEDLAIGCFSISEGAHEGIFHVSGEEEMSPYELVHKVAEHFGLDKSLIEPVDASIFKEVAKRPPRTGFDISKAKEVLRFQPRSFKEGLETVGTQLEVFE